MIFIFMKKVLFILLVSGVFMLSACSSNVSQPKQEKVKNAEKESPNNSIDECVKKCLKNEEAKKLGIDCQQSCVRNSEPYQRDQRRILDIKQIQTVLQLCFDKTGKYPPEITAGGPISCGGVSYMFRAPSAPIPFDGLCTEDNNTYKYQVVNEPQAGQSYILSFCLGGDADAGFFGEIKGGPHTATQKGIR